MTHIQRLLTLVLAGPALLAADDQPAGSDDLAKQLANPVANLISVPFQANWDSGLGPLGEGTQFKLNFQPVIPITLSDDWNLIVRTIVPYISQEDVFKAHPPAFPGLPDSLLRQIPAGQRATVERKAEKAFDEAVRKQPEDKHQDGLGDTTQSFFFSPREPVGGWVLAAGPIFLWPTATDDLLGSEKWGAGPTAIALKQDGPWTYGALTNHLWSYAGDSARQDVNVTFIQPFLSYITSTKTTFSINAETTYDWEAHQWSMPLNLVVSQMFKIGSQPLQFSLGGRWYAEGPDNGPEWGLRVGLTFLFPQ